MATFMLGITRWHVFKILAAILCIAALTWLGMAYLIPAPPSQITIATSPEGEHYHVLGTRYKGILADTGIKVELRLTDGAKEKPQTFERSELRHSDGIYAGRHFEQQTRT